MAKLNLILSLILISAHTSAFSSTDLEKKLQEKCLSTFDIIEKQNLQALIKLMPSKPSADELSHTKKYLEKKHNKWFIKGGAIKEKHKKNITYQTPSKTLVEMFGASKIMKTKISVLSKNFETDTSCSFMKINNNWYLHRLP